MNGIHNSTCFDVTNFFTEAKLEGICSEQTRYKQAMIKKQIKLVEELAIKRKLINTKKSVIEKLKIELSKQVRSYYL